MIEFGHLCIVAAGLASAWGGFRERVAKKRFDHEMEALQNLPRSGQRDFFIRQLRRDIGAESISNRLTKLGGLSLPVFVALSALFPEGIRGPTAASLGIIASAALSTLGAGLSMASIFGLSYGERFMKFQQRQHHTLDPEIMNVLLSAERKKEAVAEREELSSAAKLPAALKRLGGSSRRL